MEILLSIVTVTLNCIKELRVTWESLQAQIPYIDRKSVEIILVDGASEDGTKEYAKKIVDKLKQNGISGKLISEKDNGIYDAMNKGLQCSKGKYVYMLNAGDTFYDDWVLEKVLKKICTSEADVLYGSVLRCNELYQEFWQPGNLDELRKRMVLCHQALFIKRKEPLHRYNLQYHYCADYDLVLRLYLNNKQFENLGIIIAKYSLDGISANKAIVSAYKETRAIRKNNGVLKKSIKEKMEYGFGVCKRHLIKLLPAKIRWEITKIKRKIVKEIKY